MTPKELSADGLVTVKEAAEFLSIGRSTLWNLMDRGVLPFCKIGKSRRVPRAALQKYVLSLLARR